ncbi:MAG: hypothetical protein ACFFBD_07800 [Candidatus Hodarchaeota archaeon]
MLNGGKKFSKFQFLAGEGLYRLKADIFYLGNDVIVHLGGPGTHIGAIAFAEPYRSKKTPTASISVLSAYKHKDEPILRDGALRLAKLLKVRVVVVGGVHMDNASSEDISRLLANSKLLFDKIIDYFKSNLTSVGEGR